MVDAEQPAVLEQPVAVEHAIGAFHRVLEADELVLPLRCLFIETEKRGPGAGEVVDQVDEAKPCTRIVQVLAKIVEQVSPLVGIDLRALDELLVAEQTRICMADRVDTRPVAQSHEQGLAAQALARCLGIGVDEHAVRLDVALGPRHAEETISNEARVWRTDPLPPAWEARWRRADTRTGAATGGPARGRR